MKLLLFGYGPYDFPAAAGGTTTHTINESGLNGTLKLSRATAPVARATVNFSGNATNLVSANFDVQCEFEIKRDDGGTERLGNLIRFIVPDFKLKLPRRVETWPIRTIGMHAVALDDAESVEFVVSRNAFAQNRSVLYRVIPFTSTQALKLLRWDQSAASGKYGLALQADLGLWIVRALDLPLPTKGIPSQFDAVCTEGLRKPLPPAGDKLQQFLHLDWLQFDLNDTSPSTPSIRYGFLPARRILDIATEVWTTAQVTSPSNPLLHEYTLANGRLNFHLTLNPAGHPTDEGTSIFWGGPELRDTRGVHARPALLVHELRDENSLPLCLSVDRVPLRLREGVDGPNPPDDQITPGFILGDSALPQPVLQGNLEAVGIHSPICLTSVNVFDWLQNGTLAVASLPVEIHGFSDNSYLSRDAAPAAAQARLVLENDLVSNNPTRVKYQRAHLELPFSSESAWDLSSPFEEREYQKPDSSMGIQAVGTRRSATLTTGNARFPAVDVRFGTANLPAKAADPEFFVRDNTHRWYREADEALLTMFQNVHTDMQRHASGFRFQPGDGGNFGIESVTGRLAAAVAGGVPRIQNMLPSPTEIRVAQNTFTFGSEKPPPSYDNLTEGYRSFVEAWNRLAENASLATKTEKKLSEIWMPGVLEVFERVSQPERNLHRAARVLARLAAGELADLHEKIKVQTLVTGLATLSGFRQHFWEELRKGNLPKDANGGDLDEELAKLLLILAWTIVQVVRVWSTPGSFPARPGSLSGSDFPEFLELYHELVLACVSVTYAVTIPDFPALRVEFEKEYSAFTEAWLDETSVVAKQAGAALLRAVRPSRDLFERSVMALLTAFGESLPNEDIFQKLLKGRLQVNTTIYDVPRIDAPVLQGVNAKLHKLKSWYERLEPHKHANIRELLHRVYGPSFTRDIFKDVIQLHGPIQGQTAEKVRNALAEIIDLGNNAGDLLKTLSVEPPRYIVASRAFRPPAPPDPATLDALFQNWSRSFTLCAIGKDSWDFQLDSDSSAILKLTGDVSVLDILLEISTLYRKEDGTPDPLGLWSAELRGVDPVPVDKPPEQVKAWTQTLVRTWCASYLNRDLLNPTWRGLLVVNPLADFERHQVVRDLCGIRSLRMRYAAIGGEELPASGRASTLDVYATIFAERSGIKPPLNRETELVDAYLALIKFDARIKNAKLRENTSIELRLDLKRFWGRYETDNIAADPDAPKEGYTDIRIIGSVKAPEDVNESPTLEFAAVFRDKRRIPVDILFIKRIDLHSIRAGLRGNRTSLEIQADIIVQEKSGTGGLTFEGEKGSKIGLDGFRLNFPPASDASTPMGRARVLDIEYDALSFQLGKPRELRLGQIELKLTKIGFFRAKEKIGDHPQNGSGAGFKDRYMWLLSGKPGDREFAFAHCQVDFGKLTKLGSSGISNLKLEMLFGIERSGPDPEDIVVRAGVAGLEAREIRFDLFRLLTVTVDEVMLHAGVTGAKNGEYTVLTAKNFALKILNYPLIGSDDAKFGDKKGADLLFMQQSGPGSTGRRGFITLLRAKNLALINIDWILLGHNIALDPKVLTYLLSGQGDAAGAKSWIDGAFPKPENEADPRIIAAELTDDSSWLFGVAFSIPGILAKCRLVFQEDHYYGLYLKGNLAELLLGGKGDEFAVAYAPGATRQEDRFFLEMPLAAFNMFKPNFEAGWLTFWWSPNGSFLLGLGFPWRVGGAYRWERSFSGIVSIFEVKFGFYVSRRNVTVGTQKMLELQGGVAAYIGLGFAAGNSIAYVRAGIGVFAILEGLVRINLDQAKDDPLKSIEMIEVAGAIGIYAYGEGAIDVWVLSASFRVSVQASIDGRFRLNRGAPGVLDARATLQAEYSASCTVGCWPCEWEFSVSGSVEIGVSTQLQIDLQL